jgi:hypothetical protein
MIVFCKHGKCYLRESTFKITSLNELKEFMVTCMKIKHWFWDVFATVRSRDTSVSIVSDYRRDNRAIEGRSLAQARGFFL